MTSQKRTCTGVRKDGKPCTAWAAPGTNPPRCWRHPVTKTPTPAVKKKKVGAPRGNQNAVKHGGYSGTLPPDLDARIAALDRRLQHVENYLDIHADELTPEQYIKFANLQSQIASRLGRLMRGRDDATDATTKAEIDIDAVLQVLSTSFNIDLTGDKKK